MTPASPAAVAAAFEQFVSEFEDAGLAAQSMRAELRDIDWSRVSAVAEARERLTGRAERAATALRAFAQLHGVPADRVVRNLLAAVPRRGCYMVYLMLGARGVALAPGDAAWREVYLRERLPRAWPGAFGLAWRLLATREAPTPEELLPLLGSDPVRYIIASVVSARRDGERIDPTAALRDFIERTAGARESTRLPSGFRSMAAPELTEVAKAWTKAALPPLPPAAFATLPPDVAGTVVTDRAVRDALFGKPTAGDEAALDTELRAVHELLSQLGSHGLARARISAETLARLDPATLPANLVQVCLRAVLGADPIEVMEGRWGTSRGREWKARTRKADAMEWRALLAILAVDPPRRAGVVVSLDASTRKRLLSMLPRGTLVAMFVTASEAEERVALIEACGQAGQGPRFLGELAKVPEWLGLLPASAVPFFAEEARSGAVWSAIERQGDALPYEDLPAKVASQVATHVADLARQKACEDVLPLVRSGRALRWLLATAPSARDDLVQLLHACDAPDRDASLATWRSLARALLHEVSSANDLFPHGVSHRAFVALCELVAEHPGREAMLFEVTRLRSAKRAWVDLVRAVAAGKGAIPAGLLRAIPTDPRQLGIAAREAPALFGEDALAQLPITDLLRHAFVSLALGRWLDGRLEPGAREAQLPWVREAYKETPTRAAGYELALLCSLADAHLLYRLALQVAAHHAVRPDRPGRGYDRRYRTYRLPKRSGGTRKITAPHPALKRIQRRLLDRLFARVPLHPAATGFRPGHSTVVNASRHVGRRLVVNVDIESCFPSTKYAQILRACRIAAGELLSPRAVRLLAEICSYGGALPTGAPTSPAIANIVLRNADHAIGAAAARFGITYTRYADDLTFSGDGDVHRILPFVERVLADFGYTLAEHKVNLFRRGRRQMVTGLVVNTKPNLPRRIRRRLRAAVHARSTGKVPRWHGAPITDGALLGHLANLHAVQPAEAMRLTAQVRGAMEEAAGD